MQQVDISATTYMRNDQIFLDIQQVFNWSCMDFLKLSCQLMLHCSEELSNGVSFPDLQTQRNQPKFRNIQPLEIQMKNLDTRLTWKPDWHETRLERTWSKQCTTCSNKVKSQENLKDTPMTSTIPVTICYLERFICKYETWRNSRLWSFMVRCWHCTPV
jgi:hypothetical protein